jgi:hypothetical protein
MKVFEYITYLKQNAPDLKFNKVFFHCEHSYDGPYGLLDADSEFISLYLNTEMSSYDCEIYHRPPASLLTHLEDKDVNNYLCLEVDELY